MGPAEVFARMQAHCMAKEGAIEDYPWEHVGWKVGGKLFVIGTQDSNVFTMKSTVEKQEALIQHPAIEKSAYVGRYGWVTITVDDEATMEIALDLADESYDLVRPKRGKKRKSGDSEG
jgi:predicted DNA-binding protein (MmcQ/YjbR family)